MIRVPCFKNLFKRQFSGRPIRAYAQELVGGLFRLSGDWVRSRQKVGDRLAVAGYRESFAPLHLPEYLGQPKLGFSGFNGAQLSFPTGPNDQPNLRNQARSGFHAPAAGPAGHRVDPGRPLPGQRCPVSRYLTWPGVSTRSAAARHCPSSFKSAGQNTPNDENSWFSV